MSVIGLIPIGACAYIVGSSTSESSRAQSCTRTFGDHGPSVLDPADGFGDPLGPITSQVGPFIEGDNCFLFTHAPCSSMGQHTDFFSFSSFFTPPTFCFC